MRQAELSYFRKIQLQCLKTKQVELMGKVDKVQKYKKYKNKIVQKYKNAKNAKNAKM